jgi:miniconductance mechanosensitive channel
MAALLLTAFMAVVVYHVVKRLIILVVHRLALKTKTNWDDILVSQGVFSALAFMAPAIVFHYGMELFPTVTEIVQRLLVVYVTFVSLLVADRSLSAASEIYQSFDMASRRPIRGFIQLFKIFMYLMGLIAMIALLLGKSPWGLLSGVGALTGILMLVFKDTILSFVASIQIAATNILQKGDWVSMPAHGADGGVIDIALHTVTVQNWDKTIVTIPTYKFIEGSFKNWRGMQASGGRRIKRSLLIDQTSVRMADDALMAELMKIGLLRNYLERKKTEIDAHNQKMNIDPGHPLNGRRMTNLGCFRAYVAAYLYANPKIHRDMDFLIRHLDPTPQGIPLEIYVFSKDTAWSRYENIQADIFDHLLAALPHFGLRVFQYPTGHDFMNAHGERQAERPDSQADPQADGCVAVNDHAEW